MTMAEELKMIGRKEGIQEGKFAAMQDVAKAMLAKGLDNSMIMEITGLSADELQQLSR